MAQSQGPIKQHIKGLEEVELQRSQPEKGPSQKLVIAVAMSIGPRIQGEPALLKDQQVNETPRRGVSRGLVSRIDQQPEVQIASSEYY